MIYSLTFLSGFLSVFCFYFSSEKIEINSKPIAIFLRKNKVLSVLLGILFFGVSTVLLTLTQGVLSGIFCSVVLWILLGSLTLLLAPFEKIRLTHLIGLLSGMLSIELIVNTIF